MFKSPPEQARGRSCSADGPPEPTLRSLLCSRCHPPLALSTVPTSAEKVTHFLCNPEPVGTSQETLYEETEASLECKISRNAKNHKQDKIQKLYERKIKEGMDMNYIIQRKKEFRNPSIYEKLIQFCAIDELGTNYPKDMFDPHGWSEDSYYEALAKAQKIEMDKLEKAKKERTKIEFVTGTKKGTTTNATATTTTTASTAVADAQKRKSKWDSAIPVTTIAQPTILTTTATLPAVVTVTTSASGSKTTVISAVGTIVKKAKQ
uniref:SAP30 binding protein n=1 Tax=Sus scrofa TaxID=9823 RepID=A0A8D1TWN1_PIG